jgi:hypothetical protein
MSDLRRGSATAWRAALALAGLALPPGAGPVRAQQPQSARRELSAELFGGAAWSLRSPLTVRLPGEAPVTHRARWSTRPLADAPYYAYRVGYGSPARGVEAELVHHKLYLENPAPPVERFEVTHGYNLATANVRAPAGRYQVRAGLGVVVAHAEGRVAGRAVGERRTRLGGGYHLAGVTLQLAAGRRYPFGRGAVAAYAAPELKLTASRARVPLGEGSVSVPNVALHVLGGLGVRRRW